MFKFFSRNRKKDKKSESFLSFVLLSEPVFDFRKLAVDLTDRWGIDCSQAEISDNVFVCQSGGMTVVVSLCNYRVPNGEAEGYAASNYMWTDAVEVSKTHRAHLIVLVSGGTDDYSKTGFVRQAELATKTVDSCLAQKNAIAVYSDGAVYEPRFFQAVAESMKDGILPLLDWVWFGISETKGMKLIYTYGLRKFGKEEIELVTDSAAVDFKSMRVFLYDIVSYLIKDNATISDGEIIEFTADQHLPVKLSKGIAVFGKTLKIQYPAPSSSTLPTD